MKFPLLLFISLIIGNNLYCQQKISGIVFEERIFDFQEIQEQEGKISHTFTFQNIGEKPIVISRVVSGCSCTSFLYDNKPVLPKQDGKIVVTYNPAYRPGFFSKEVTIYTNNSNVSRVWIKGTVIPYLHPVEEDYPYDFGNGLHLNLKVLAFGKLEDGQKRYISLRYANDTDKPMSLTFTTDPADKNISYTNPKDLSPKERGEFIVFYTMHKNNNRKNYFLKMYPVINGQKLGKYIDVKVYRK